MTPREKMMTNLLRKQDMLSVINIVHAYAWGFDKQDREGLLSIFSEQSETSGTVKWSDISWGPWQGRDTLVDNLIAIRASQKDVRRHQMTTPVFLHLSSEKAEVKVYVSIFSALPPNKPVLVTTGDYRVSLSKYDGEWKIDSLIAELDGAF